MTCSVQLRGGILAAVFVALAIMTPARADFAAGKDAYDAGDYATAYAEWLPLARQGNAAAQNSLGVLYDEGRGVVRDLAEAARWFHKAADQGDELAQIRLNRLERRQRLARLTVGLVPADFVAPIVNDGVNLRDLPEPDADLVRQLTKGRQVHVTGVLGSGWLRVAEEGEPVGWIFKTAVAPAALAEGIGDEEWFLPLRSELATKPTPATRPGSATPTTTPTR